MNQTTANQTTGKLEVKLQHDLNNPEFFQRAMDAMALKLHNTGAMPELQEALQRKQPWVMRKMSNEGLAILADFALFGQAIYFSIIGARNAAVSSKCRDDKVEDRVVDSSDGEVG